MTPQLLNVDEARRALGIGKTKLYELISSGELRTVTVGRRRLVSADALCRYVEHLEASSS